MKIPNECEFQTISSDHSSDSDFEDFVNLDKKCTAKSYSFLVIDATVGSDNSLGFRKNILERF